MNDRLREKGMFLPHGQCAHVHLGGHVQTGGYSLLIRAFGLLSDYVEGFDIVLANGDHVRIWKPDSGMADQDQRSNSGAKQFDNDLYWAVLGGSPGNYGILTHVWLRPLHDTDYPNSRGMKLLSVYSKKKLAKVLKVIAEMNEDKNLPRDFDICCSVLSEIQQSHIGRSRLNSKPGFKNFDEKMLIEHPKQYGVGVKWAEKGKMSAPDTPWPIIVIFLQWSNVEGIKHTFGEQEKNWFSRIREAFSPNKLDDRIRLMSDTIFAPAAHALKNWMHEADVQNWMYVNEHKHTPLSQLMRYWCWEDIREYVKPYEKRFLLSNRYDLSNNGWPEWVSQRVEQIVHDGDKDTSILFQAQIFGGDNSMFRRNNEPELYHGCHSWRSDTTIGMAFDCFYQPEDENPLKDGRLRKVLEFQAENETCTQEGKNTGYTYQFLPKIAPR